NSVGEVLGIFHGPAEASNPIAAFGNWLFDVHDCEQRVTTEYVSIHGNWDVFITPWLDTSTCHSSLLKTDLPAGACVVSEDAKYYRCANWKWVEDDSCRDPTVDHQHAVECTVFGENHSPESVPSDSFSSKQPSTICEGYDCQRWFGSCKALAST